MAIVEKNLNISLAPFAPVQPSAPFERSEAEMNARFEFELDRLHLDLDLSSSLGDRVGREEFSWVLVG